MAVVMVAVKVVRKVAWMDDLWVVVMVASWVAVKVALMDA